MTFQLPVVACLRVSDTEVSPSITIILAIVPPTSFLHAASAPFAVVVVDTTFRVRRYMVPTRIASLFRTQVFPLAL